MCEEMLFVVHGMELNEWDISISLFYPNWHIPKMSIEKQLSIMLYYIPLMHSLPLQILSRCASPLVFCSISHITSHTKRLHVEIFTETPAQRVILKFPFRPENPPIWHIHNKLSIWYSHIFARYSMRARKCRYRMLGGSISDTARKGSQLGLVLYIRRLETVELGRWMISRYFVPFHVTDACDWNERWKSITRIITKQHSYTLE